MWTVRHPTAAVAIPRRTPDNVWWAVLGFGVVLTVIARAAWLAVAPTPDDVEVSLVGQVLAIAGVDPSPSGVSPAALQVAAWTTTGAFDRAASVLAAAREAMLLTSAIGGVLAWFLARRLGLGRPWAAAALVLLAICPPLLDVQRTVVAANVALPWLLGAMLLAARPPAPGARGLLRDGGVVGCVVAGVVTAPITVALVPAVLWLAARERPPRRALVLAGTVVCATATATVLTRFTGAPVRDAGLGNLLDPGRLTADPVTPLVIAVVAILGLGLASTRPIAAGLALVPVVAGVTGEPWAAVVATAAPIAVLLLAALVGYVVENAARPVRHLRRIPRAHLYAPIGTAATVVVALALWSPVIARLPETLDAGATDAAREWMAQNGATSDLVLADSRTQLAIVNARDWAHTRTGPAAAAGEVVATFGEGADVVSVRAVPVAGIDMQRETAARRGAGEQLAASDRLDAPEPLRALLRAGRVNPQAALTLGTLLTDQRVRLVDLPVVAAEDAVGQPRRHLLLQPVDGGTDRVVAFYLLQRGAFRPAAAVLTPDGVLVSYPPVPETGLLDPFQEGPS
ncbi:MAG: hypothetical protein ACT4RN_21055 [Pseudonocardia sp.]